MKDLATSNGISRRDRGILIKLKETVHLLLPTAKVLLYGSAARGTQDKELSYLHCYENGKKMVKPKRHNPMLLTACKLLKEIGVQGVFPSHAKLEEISAFIKENVHHAGE